MDQNRYTFHCLEIRYTYGVLFSVFGGIFGLLAIIVFMAANGLGDYMLAVMGPIGIVVVGFSAYYVIKAVKSGRKPPDKIEWGSSGFCSKRFGRVDFNKVGSYRITTGFSKINRDKPAPSLHIKLKNGKKIRYDLNVKHYEQEIDDYLSFIDKFVEAMEPAAEKKYSVSASAGKKTKYEGKAHAHSNYEAAKEGLKKAKKAKKSRSRRFTVPISLAVGLMVLARACGPDIVDQFKSHPLQDIRKTTQARFNRQMTRLRTAIDQEGPVFLFTNDTSAKTQLYPNVEASYDAGVPLFQKSDAASKIDDFLEHKDSLGFSTMLVRSDTVLVQRPTIPVSGDKEAKHLYLTIFDSQNQLNRNESTQSRYYRQSKGRVALSWVVSYQEVHDLKDSLTHAFPSLRNLGRTIDERPGMNLYVVASAYKGTDEEEFRAAMEVVKDFLSKSEADTSKFDISVYNRDKKEEGSEEIRWY